MPWLVEDEDEDTNIHQLEQKWHNLRSAAGIGATDDVLEPALKFLRSLGPLELPAAGDAPPMATLQSTVRTDRAEGSLVATLRQHLAYPFRRYLTGKGTHPGSSTGGAPDKVLRQRDLPMDKIAMNINREFVPTPVYRDGDSFQALLLAKREDYDPYALLPEELIKQLVAKGAILKGQDQDIFGNPLPVASIHRTRTFVGLNKVEANLMFHRLHGSIHPSISLSKLQSLRRKAFKFADGKKIHISTVATAWVHFERLVLLGVVNKANRTTVLAGCLLLAVKFQQDDTRQVVEYLLKQALSVHFAHSTTAHQILQAEFDIMAHLRFCLDVPYRWVAPHLVAQQRDTVFAATPSRIVEIGDW